MSTRNALGVTFLNSLDDKYKELKSLEIAIDQMRDKLHNMMMNTLDPLNDEVLALSRELDEIIHRYTALKMELKDY
jgi:hypothetical protein